MVSPHAKVHEWLMKSPDPPRQARERTVASPRSLPKPCLQYTPPRHEASLQSSSMVCKAVTSKAVSENSLDTHQRDIVVKDDKDERGHPLEIIDENQGDQVEEEGHGDDWVHLDCLPSTSIWEDAMILFLCTVHWLTVMALVCFLAGLIIVWTTGYKLGLRTHSQKM
ncbi:hypothetical protein TMatcc_004371 [Talaromyces marneffei ATCC 18224]|nr:uncharacterized protein EYB26_000677 [Talaromyces marneffei]KAE8556952.1 hypothetical protein EYB25_001658 [Talaromyces marneffei]QGA13032.1 hypothetical protein EYB26_000677 [Talaromyces marneffei]